MKRLRLFSPLAFLGLAFLLLNASIARSETSIQRSFRFNPGQSLIVDTERCNISIVGSDRDDIRITAECNDEIEKYHKLEFAELSTGLKIKSRVLDREEKHESLLDHLGVLFGNSRRIEKLNLTISIPQQANIQICNSRGKIEISSIDGDVDVANTRSPVYCTNITGSLNLANSRDIIEVSSVDGPVNIQNSRGVIKVANLLSGGKIVNSRGNIHLDSSSGDFIISNSRGHTEVNGLRGRVNGSSSRGNLKVSFAGQPTGDCELKTNRGHLEICVPENSAACITAEVNRGKVYSDRPVFYKYDRGGVINGDKSENSPNLKLSATRGNIRIKSSGS